jgi:hypothetical protein
MNRLKGMANGTDSLRSSPLILLAMAAVFALVGFLDGLNAYRSGKPLDIGLASLWFLGAAIWLLRYRAEQRFRQGL